MQAFLSLFDSVPVFLSTDPSVLLLQGIMVASALVVVFLVLFTLRDILLRTTSCTYQILSILLVALLPVVGFLLYLLLRPSRTLRERSLEKKLDDYLAHVTQHAKKHSEKKK